MRVLRPRPLSDRQRQALAAISLLERRHGRSPSLREMAAEMSITRQAMSEQLLALRLRGLIERETGVPHSTKLTSAGVAELGGA